MIRRREWIGCTLLGTSALATHVACTWWLSAHDPIATAASGHVLSTAFVVVALLVARTSLLVTAGWWLWLLAKLSYRRFSRPRTEG